MGEGHEKLRILVCLPADFRVGSQAVLRLPAGDAEPVESQVTGRLSERLAVTGLVVEVHVEVNKHHLPPRRNHRIRQEGRQAVM